MTTNNRTYCLEGIRGIGKSSLARSTLHYAAERRMFRRGCLFIKCDELQNTYALYRQIDAAIQQKISLTDKQNEARKKVACEEELKNYLVGFFKHSHEFKSLKRKPL